MRVRLFRYLILLILSVFLSAKNGKAQECDYYLGSTRYTFIDYKANKILFPDQTESFDKLFAKMQRITDGEQEQIRIVHMGGSHIQADIYTHLIRKRLQQLTPDMSGSRGLLFPYKMAKTNNPSNFGVDYKGDWLACKSTRSNNPCPLGLAGIAVYTSDSLASVSIKIRNDQNYFSEFDSLRIFHEPCSYRLQIIAGRDTLAGQYDSTAGCTGFKFSSSYNAFKLELIRLEKTARFSLLGISLDSDAPGIVYNAIGVNGAKLSSYLRCELYGKHIKAVNPDLVIISIGTNDAYTRNFNKELYYREYSELVRKTKAEVPNAAILLTIPNDSYYIRKYVNKNTEQMRKLILQLAEEYKCGIWDFYTIMGGLNSAQAWYSLGLMQRDRVHFTRKGYELKGELFFSAFLKTWEALLPEMEYQLKQNNY